MKVLLHRTDFIRVTLLTSEMEKPKPRTEELKSLLGQTYPNRWESRNDLCEYYHFLCIHQFRVRFVQLYDLILIILNNYYRLQWILGYSGFLFGDISRLKKRL